MAAIFLLTATPVPLFAGSVEATEGAAESEAVPVVKLHMRSDAIAFPERSLIPVVIVTVYKVLSERFAEGIKLAIRPEYASVPETGVCPGPVTLNMAPVIVAGSMISLKVAAIFLLIATPVMPLDGSVEVTVGAVASELVPVVKLHE